jgi:hypothetical protein
LVFLPGISVPRQFLRTPRKPANASAMDSATLRPETTVSHPAPQFHSAPRHSEPGASEPSYFARFDTTGHTLELFTPTTHECYVAATIPAPSTC